MQVRCPTMLECLVYEEGNEYMRLYESIYNWARSICRLLPVSWPVRSQSVFSQAMLRRFRTDGSRPTMPSLTSMSRLGWPISGFLSCAPRATQLTECFSMELASLPMHPLWVWSAPGLLPGQFTDQWADQLTQVDGGVGTVGITAHAADALGDIVFVELPEVDSDFNKGYDQKYSSKCHK